MEKKTKWAALAVGAAALCVLLVYGVRLAGPRSGVVDGRLVYVASFSPLLFGLLLGLALHLTGALRRDIAPLEWLPALLLCIPLWMHSESPAWFTPYPENSVRLSTLLLALVGIGCVDAALNNYVALHYKSRHMNLLHCMWGLGASIGPYIMGWALSGGSWNAGYRTIAIFQAALSAVLFLSLPLWKRPAGGAGEEAPAVAVPKRELLRLPGAKAILVAFLCYQAVENTVGIWASSYLVLHRGLAEAEAAKLASLFYIGITAGRGLCGFVNLRLSDDGMIRLGQGVVLVGLALLFIPGSSLALYIGLGLVGLGCAPIYPSIIHSTPEHFGASRSQSMIGLEMACAYVGTTAAPPLFGLIANHLSIALFPAYLLAFLALMFLCHELLVKRAGAAK